MVAPEVNRIARAIVGNGDGGSVSGWYAIRGEVRGPVGGYMVSRSGSEWRVPASDAYDAAVAFFEKHKERAEAWDLYFGGWRDGDHFYLDLSECVYGLETALGTARAHNQIAIWDVDGGTEIRL